jgi:predicted nucleic acid-binding protein
MVDTNVLIDILHDDPEFADASAAALERALSKSSVFINSIVFAELSARYSNFDRLVQQLEGMSVTFEPTIALEAAFHAGKAHGQDRQNKGKHQAILADFLIGGHAQALGAAILTRDKQRFERYFPSLTLITPETPDG